MTGPAGSIRRRHAGIVAAACAWSVVGLLAVDSPRAPGSSQVDELVLWNRLDPYLSVIANYRAGKTAQALWEIRFWSDDDLAKEVERLDRLRHVIRICRETKPPIDGRASPGEIEVADLEAAVLLHTDAMLDAVESRSAAGVGRHLVAAERLLEWTRERTRGWSWIPQDLPQGCDPPSPLGRRDWYLAMTWALLGHWEADLADFTARNGLDAAPDDPEMLLAAGTVKEALALDATQFANARSNPPRAIRDVLGKLPRRNARQSLSEALVLYRRALGVQSVNVQARLRFGRVLSQLGRLDEARRALELVAADADEGRERYLAELFLARVAEQASDAGDAVQRYQRAIGAWPDSQAARVGLIHILGNTDDGAGVPQMLQQLLSQPWPRSIESDPWWTYPFGEADRGARLLDELRRRFVVTP